jgi:hypothetical protein
MSVEREVKAPWLEELRGIHEKMAGVSEAEVQAALDADAAGATTEPARDGDGQRSTAADREGT